MVFLGGSDTRGSHDLWRFSAYTPCPMAADCRRYGDVHGFFQHCGGCTPLFRNPRGCSRFRRHRSGGLKAAILLRICGAAAFYGVLVRIRHAPWRQIAAATEKFAGFFNIAGDVRRCLGTRGGCTRFRRHRSGGLKAAILLRICGAAAFYGILLRIRQAPWRQIAAATETYRFRRHRRGDARGVVYHCGDVRGVVTAVAVMYAIPRSTRPFSRARTARRPRRPGTRTRPRS